MTAYVSVNNLQPGSCPFLPLPIRGGKTNQNDKLANGGPLEQETSMSLEQAFAAEREKQ
jgi:hypothetical protein